MLLDDLLEHLNCLVSLICQDKTCGQLLLGICVVRLQFENAQIQRDCFLELLRGCVVIGYVLKDARIICGIFPRFFEDLVGLR